MTLFPILPYRFIVMTLTGIATIDIPATQWDVPAKAELSGEGAAMVQDYISAHGIGYHGQLFTLDAVAPVDLHHALLMNATVHHELSVRSFDVIGYVPSENPSDTDPPEDDGSEDDEGDDEDNVMESSLPFDPTAPWRTELDEAMSADFIMESAKKAKDPNFKPWTAQPSLVGRLKGKALEDVNELGFATDESVVMLSGAGILHIKELHGTQLSEDDGKYLRLAIEHPDEVLPNKAKSLPGGGKDYRTMHREKSVLMIHRAERDYMVIVEIGPKDGTNIVWNFWKMNKKKANGYLAPARQEKALLLQSRGATVHIPRVPPDGLSGKPEGLPGSQTEEAGSQGSAISKDGEPVKPITESATAEEIHAAAHEAATSHLNDLPQPTEAQKEAGTYRMGHIRIHGMGITIENPKGSTRQGVDPDGIPWKVTMPAHYGYVKKSLGADGDHIDVNIGDHHESELVFVVDQVDAVTGKFDEHKCVLGTLSQKEAHDLYISGFSDGKGPKRLGAMTAMHMPAFKAWLDEGDTTKPMSDNILEAASPASPASPADVEKIRAQIQELRNQAHKLKGKKTVFQQGKASIVSASDMDIQKADKLFLEANQIEDQWYLALNPEKFTANEKAEAIGKGMQYLAPAYVTAIQSATSVDDIAAVFRELWPGLALINRLTDNQNGSNVEAPQKEGAMEIVTKDGFTKELQGTAYYIDQLAKMGCPNDLLDIAKELTAKKKPLNVSNSSEDGIQEDTIRWDGSEFYYLSKGEWGFNRIQIMPYNGYVDFGQGNADTARPEVIEPTTAVIATFRNEEDGTETRVAKISTGFSVTLKDLDSGEVVPTATVYPTEEQAIAKAKEIAGVKDVPIRAIPKGMHPETHAVMEAELTRMEAEFPSLKEWAANITTMKGGHATYSVWDKAVRLNDYLAKHTPDEISKNWNESSQVSGGFRSTVIHEAAHALHHAMIEAAGDDDGKEALWNDLKVLEKSLGYPSEYSKKNMSEWFAERFTEEELHGAEPVLKSFIKKTLRGGP